VVPVIVFTEVEPAPETTSPPPGTAGDAAGTGHGQGPDHGTGIGVQAHRIDFSEIIGVRRGGGVGIDIRLAGQGVDMTGSQAYGFGIIGNHIVDVAFNQSGNLRTGLFIDNGIPGHQAMGLTEIKAAVDGIDLADLVEVVITSQLRINGNGGNTAKRQITGMCQTNGVDIVIDDVVVLAVCQPVDSGTATAFVADGVAGVKVMVGRQIDPAAGGINLIRADKPMLIGGV